MRATRVYLSRYVTPLMNSQKSVTTLHQVIRSVMEQFDPGAIVLQCGTDSLSGDKLGCLNLSMRGAWRCRLEEQ